MNKRTSIILIVIIALLGFYTIFSGVKKQREINRLTRELTNRVDSLKSLQSNYDVILKKYEHVYSQLDSTKSRFVSFYHDVDSITHTTITSIEKIRQTLALLKQEHKYIAKLDTTPIGPVFP